MDAVEPKSKALPVMRVADLPVDEQPRRWLVEGLWSAAAVGLIGGAPKCCKSWLGLDLAISVATGTPCINHFDVHETGAALIYLAEDSNAIVRDRACSIARSRALSISRIDVSVITASTLRLDNLRDRDRLRHTIAQLRPRLVVLDPLVRLHSIDENSATEVAQLLSFIRTLQREFDVAVILVHHTRKNTPSGTQAGQGLRGSGDWHAFGDSNLYLRRQRQRLILSMEHRAAAAPDPIQIELVDDPAIHLRVRDTVDLADADLDERILAALSCQRSKKAELRNRLGVRNQLLGDALKRLNAAARITQHDGYWQLE